MSPPIFPTAQSRVIDLTRRRIQSSASLYARPRNRDAEALADGCITGVLTHAITVEARHDRPDKLWHSGSRGQQATGLPDGRHGGRL